MRQQGGASCGDDDSDGLAPWSRRPRNKIPPPPTSAWTALWVMVSTGWVDTAAGLKTGTVGAGSGGIRRPWDRAVGKGRRVMVETGSKEAGSKHEMEAGETLDGKVTGAMAGRPARRATRGEVRKGMGKDGRTSSRGTGSPGKGKASGRTLEDKDCQSGPEPRR